VVDKVAIALVGRDPSGRGVGLGEVTLMFETVADETPKSELAATAEEPTG
jgi:hypothetical protein